jgi:hypothetical protein
LHEATNVIRVSIFIVVVGHQIAHLLLDVGPQRHDKLDVDIGFDEGARYFGEEGIEAFGGDSFIANAG